MSTFCIDKPKETRSPLKTTIFTDLDLFSPKLGNLGLTSKRKVGARDYKGYHGKGLSKI